MSHIDLKANDQIATITLNRPEKLNAFAGTMREDLIAALDEVGASDARVLIITGAGRAFCAGGDVEYMSGLQKERATEPFEKLLAAGKRIVMTIRALPQPVIASINGVAAGAGCNLALACDVRIASSEAKLAQSFVKIGLHPDWGGTYFLPRLVGPSRAMEIMLSGRLVGAEEAASIGMVDRVVAPEELPDEAMKLAQTIAGGPPLAVRMIKRSVYESFTRGLEGQLDAEAANQTRAFLSSDAGEGMAAFFERRAAVFRGE